MPFQRQRQPNDAFMQYLKASHDSQSITYLGAFKLTPAKSLLALDLPESCVDGANAFNPDEGIKIIFSI